MHPMIRCIQCQVSGSTASEVRVCHVSGLSTEYNVADIGMLHHVQVLSNVPHTPNSLRVEGFCAEAMPVVMRGDVKGLVRWRRSVWGADSVRDAWDAAVEGCGECKK
ncbi:hypothetical protein F5887DRAFT_922497 [Amanita rubescens]|nr:hypothetical protein F5887DRAFT_922497 [Amanita rubescens]